MSRTPSVTDWQENCRSEPPWFAVFLQSFGRNPRKTAFNAQCSIQFLEVYLSPKPRGEKTKNYRRLQIQNLAHSAKITGSFDRTLSENHGFGKMQERNQKTEETYASSWQESIIFTPWNLWSPISGTAILSRFLLRPKIGKLGFLFQRLDETTWWFIPRIVSGLVHPSYKWTIAPTYPIYNQCYNPLTKWDEPPSRIYVSISCFPVISPGALRWCWSLGRIESKANWFFLLSTAETLGGWVSWPNRQEHISFQWGWVFPFKYAQTSQRRLQPTNRPNVFEKNLWHQLEMTDQQDAKRWCPLSGRKDTGSEAKRCSKTDN